VGFLSSLACPALLIDMTVAILTESLSTLPKGLSPLSWLDDFLYLPEVLYVLFFIWLIALVRESSASITGSPASS
jgi:putative oxidoreductase